MAYANMEKSWQQSNKVQNMVTLVNFILLVSGVKLQ
jgi:hypothetical protein